MSDPNIRVSVEIWSIIFTRLPPQSLGRCCCVCKPWNSLIVSPPFLTAHLKKYTQNPANRLLLYRQFTEAPENQEQYTLFRDSADSNEEKLEVRDTFTCPFMARKKGFHFRVVGSVNGLVCLSDDLFGYSYVVILWNPFIRKYINLPVPGATYHVTVGAYICMLGFGYDFKKGDHKVVRLVYLTDKKKMDITPPKAELYSVLEGKWRWVSAHYLANICVCDIRWSQCFLNGNIHWVAWERDGKTRVFQRNCLLLFDVEKEIFKIMKLPEALSKVNPLNLAVSDYNGKLSVLYSVRKGGYTGKEMDRCEIWVKNEYTLGKSWCQMAKIELDSTCLSWVQCLSKRGVLGFTKQGRLVSYDSNTEEVKRLSIRGRLQSWFTCGFTESLVLLDKKDGVGTYNEIGNLKKRFDYNIDPKTHAQTMVENEVVIDDTEEKEKPADNLYYQGEFSMCEQLMKLGGGKHTPDISEFLGELGMQ